MTEIIPFRGIYYDREKVSCSEIVAPPYDLISKEMRSSLCKKNAHNIVSIDFGREHPDDSDEHNKYSRAAAFFDQWLREKVLLKSDKPVYYAYSMEFDHEGARKRLSGLFGLVRLVELGEGVFPHEATHSKPKNDRLALMKAVQANTSPIYSLYNSSKRDGVAARLAAATAEEPYFMSTDDDGTVHRFWIIGDPGDVEAIRTGLKEMDIFIADGHHRYETALDYQGVMEQDTANGGGPEPFDYVLMFLADINDASLAVLPTHRVITVDAESIVEKIVDHFDVHELAPDVDLIKEIKGQTHTFGLYAAGQKYRLVFKDVNLTEVNPVLRDLDVVILHKLIFGRLLDVGSWGYEMEAKKVYEMVDDGDYDAAFFLNPTPVSSVREVALAGLRMPPKSTYFYPKVQTGFVMNSLRSF